MASSVHGPPPMSLLLLLLLLASSATSELLAMSKVERCVAQGDASVGDELASSTTGETTCKKKLVLTLTVSNSQGESEWLTINSAKDASGQDLPMAQPYVFIVDRANNLLPAYLVPVHAVRVSVYLSICPSLW